MTEDFSHVHRLKEEQEGALQENSQRRKQWEKFRENYCSVKSLLSTLPDKISHDVMIPIGSVALLPGALIHTNEIMVLLGDNLFTSRSAKQAMEIIDRRIKHVNRNLANLRRERDLISKDLDFTNYFEDTRKGLSSIYEIKEEVPDYLIHKKADKRWVARKSKHSKIPVTFKFESNQTPTSITNQQNLNQVDDALFARLDQLELEEKLENQDVGDSSCAKESKAVRFDDQLKVSSSGISRHSEDLDSDDTDTEETSNDNGIILFSHSKSCPEEKEENGEEKINSKSFEEMNPGDIVAQFGSVDEKPLKSILKKERKLSSESVKPKPILKNSPEHKPGVLSNEAGGGADDPRSILKGTAEAFSGVVVEHTSTKDKATSNEEKSSKPVSKFKSSRKAGK